MNLPYYVKPIYAGIVTLLGSLLAAMLAGTEAVGVGEISQAAWVSIVLATVIAIGGTLGLQSAPASVATSVK